MTDTGDIRTRLTDDQKTALTLWRTKAEQVLAQGGAPATELLRWLNALGFVYSSSQLTLPYSIASTYAAPWTDFEEYIKALNWYLRYGSYRYNGVLRTPISATVKNAYNALLALYPVGTSVYTVWDGVYDSANAVLTASDSTLRAAISGYNKDTVLAGILVLYGVFAIWSTDHWNQTYLTLWTVPTTSSTVGPYTVTVNWCENGVISWVTETENKHTAHQSIDAEILLQDKVNTTFAAYENLAATSKKSLLADVFVRANVPVSLAATLPLRGNVPTSLRAYEALQDIFSLELSAGGYLQDVAYSSLAATERLVGSYYSFDADLCIQDEVQSSLTAKMLLLPDSEAELKVLLEKYHIQKFRITAEPISYDVFNSKTDKEVMP